ncbi:MAG: EamA family transporter RarD [Desulfovibrio sp.]|nr:EamA family transporter RarD [Desulfovibrio sp.]
MTVARGDACPLLSQSADAACKGNPLAGTAKPVFSERPALSASGVPAAFCAFVWWGILPIFWKALSSVDSIEVLCHRITWSFATVAPFMLFRGRLGGLLLFLRSRRNLLGLLLGGFLLAGNWYLYIWAITSNMVVEASLGYYITPLVNIFFGIVVFHEKASPLVLLSIAVAAVAVIYRVSGLGHLPYVPLGLALSFGIYGLLRKTLPVEALSGLFVETLVVLPLAAGYLVWQAYFGTNLPFRHDPSINFLLVGSGLITSVPLLCFAYGARRIRMTTLGILQYMTPSCILLLGILLYEEPFGKENLITFTLIWLALILYSWDGMRRRG